MKRQRSPPDSSVGGGGGVGGHFGGAGRGGSDRGRRRQDPVSCSLCRAKKLKCSREMPCSNCRARGLGCDFNALAGLGGGVRVGADTGAGALAKEVAGIGERWVCFFFFPVFFLLLFCFCSGGGGVYGESEC